MAEATGRRSLGEAASFAQDRATNKKGIDMEYRKTSHAIGISGPFSGAMSASVAAPAPPDSLLVEVSNRLEHIREKAEGNLNRSTNLADRVFGPIPTTAEKRADEPLICAADGLRAHMDVLMRLTLLQQEAIERLERIA